MSRPPPPPVVMQQGCPTAPQLPQLPLEQVPATAGHADPEPVQSCCTQHPPPEQLLPGQQGWPAPPHAAQTPLAHAVPPAH